MRIGIDARMMTPKATRGIGRYIEELIRAMLSVAPEHTYVLVTRRTIHPFSSHPSVETVVADIPWYGLREQLAMPGILRSLRADVVHVPHWNVPMLYCGPLVVTIHDLLLRHEPTSARVSTRHPTVIWLKRVGFLLTLAMAIRHARRILVPTEFTAKDVAHFYPRIQEKIIVTGEGMVRRHLSPAPPDPQPTGKKFLLYVGSAYPHKGLDVLFAAWEELSFRHPDLHLLIAGAEDVFMRRLKDTVRTKQLKRIEFLGYVDDEHLARLYRDATAFVFPSRFEGFGLPPLEALQAGCPVISSDAGALPEVLGQSGAIFFQSGSENGMIRAVEMVLQDPPAARRRARAALADLQGRHDWKRTAQRTLDAYTSIVSWRNG